MSRPQLGMRWRLTWRADPRLAALADRHYSRKTPGASQFAPPGPVVCLVTESGDAGWVTWRTAFPKAESLVGAWCCCFFRNEGSALSSELILEALAATAALWPLPRIGTSTFVDARAVRPKRDPGYCFRMAGFREIGRTSDRGLVILSLDVADHPEPVEPLGFQRTLDAA